MLIATDFYKQQRQYSFQLCLATLTGANLAMSMCVCMC